MSHSRSPLPVRLESLTYGFDGGMLPGAGVLGTNVLGPGETVPGTGARLGAGVIIVPGVGESVGAGLAMTGAAMPSDPYGTTGTPCDICGELHAPHWIGEQMGGAVVPQANVGARLVQQPEAAAVAQETIDKTNNLRMAEPPRHRL